MRSTEATPLYRHAVGRKFGEFSKTSVTLLPVLASALASVITGTALVATRFVVSGSDGLTIATAALRGRGVLVCFHSFRCLVE